MITRGGRWIVTVSLAGILAGLISGYGLYLVSGLAGLVVFGCAFLWVRSSLDVRVGRSVSAWRVVRGADPWLATLTVRNDGSRIAAGLLARERVGNRYVELAVPRLAPGADWEREFALPSAQRAVLQLGPTEIRMSDPFAIVERNVEVGDAAFAFVHPKRHLTEQLPLGVRKALDAATKDSARGSQVFHAVREYVPGDDRRQIHWRTTAKNGGRLMVREHIDVSQPDLVILLDNGAERQDAETFEECVEVVASIGCAVIDAGSPLRAVLWGEGECVPARGDRKEAFLDFLAGVSLASRPPPNEPFTEFASSYALSGHSVLLVSPPFDTKTAAVRASDMAAFAARQAVVIGTSDTAAIPDCEMVQAASAEAACADWLRQAVAAR